MTATPTTVIKSGSIEQLLGLLVARTLDPTFEEYGNFISDDLYHCTYDHERHEYVSDKSKPMYPGVDGMVSFFGNFYDYSGVFNIDTNDQELIDTLTPLIRTNQATEAYARAKVEIAENRARLAASNRRARQ